MKEQYKDTYIYKICSKLDLSIKELALLLGKTYKTIEHWRRDESSIPVDQMKFMNLLCEKKELENEIIRLSKDRREIGFLEVNIFGKVNLLKDTKLPNLCLENLRPKTTYKMIIEEV